MPANLTHQYHKAEAAYRQADSPQELLECLQWMLREIPKHKGTDRLQADLKAKIAKAKLEAQKPNTGSAAKSAATKIPKQGAGRILLLGAPNTGKSQLLAALTQARPEIAHYPFTTQTPLPGMMAFEDCFFQLIDLPPITSDFFAASTLSLVRGADLVLLVIDLSNDRLVEETAEVLAHFSAGKTRLGRQSLLDENDVGVSYTQTLVLLNKCDAPEAGQRQTLLDEFLPLDLDRLQVSALAGTGLDALRTEAFRRLEVVRVYTKHPQEKEADRTKPVTIRRGETLVHVAENLHRDLASGLKGGRVWGRGMYDATLVKPDYQPQDGDIVELHTG